jgi:spectrin beta
MKKIKDIDRLQSKYETNAQSLIDWAKAKTIELDNRNELPNNLSGIQGELQDFKNYRLQEKPPKFEEKGQIEAEFLNIQGKLKANHMR